MDSYNISIATADDNIDPKVEGRCPDSLWIVTSNAAIEDETIRPAKVTIRLSDLKIRRRLGSSGQTNVRQRSNTGDRLTAGIKKSVVEGKPRRN